MTSFYIYTLGCKVNRAESETISAALIAHGWKESKTAKDSDLIIVNTCTVTGEADAKNRKIIRSLLRESNAPVLVTGCAINIDADHYSDIDSRVRCEKDKSEISAVAQQMIGSALRSDTEDQLSSTFLAGMRANSENGFRTRIDLKVQDGCNNACTYCIVHIARGPAHSLPADQVIEQTREIARAGAKELVLVGIDLAAYNDGDTDLSTLVKRMQNETDIARIRISSVEPQSMTPPLIDLLAQSDGRLCRHLHLCLQSGSTKVLQEMNRHYTADEFMMLVNELRNKVPTIALSTDVIVGFPGETDADFEESFELIEQAGFMRLHVFRYSKRPGTPAAERKDQIDPRIKAARSDALLKLGRHLALKDMERRIGTCEQVIVERPGLGTSESYHAIVCDKKLEPGSLIQCEFIDINEQKSQIIAKAI